MKNQAIFKSLPALLIVSITIAAFGCKKSTPAPPPSPEVLATFFGAALNGNREVVATNIQNRIDVNLIDENGNSALMLASYNGHHEIVEMLLKSKADLTLRNPTGRTALMFACTLNSPDTVKLLLEYGAHVNAVDSEEHWSPLMFAAAEGHTAVVDILLAHKANPKMADIDGETSVDFAKSRGHIELANKLKQLL